MGSKWPDKHDKIGFGNVARGGGIFFRVAILSKLTVWALGWFEERDCSPYDTHGMFLWHDIISVGQIAHSKCDCRTVILAIIFYKSSVTGLGVYTRRWVYDNITPHSLCYLARVRPVAEITIYSWFQWITTRVCAYLDLMYLLLGTSWKHWPYLWSWWRHQMETFSTLLAICVGNSPVTGEFPTQMASNAELWCYLWSASE